MPTVQTADKWRRILGLRQGAPEAALESAFENAEGIGAKERVWRAREALEKLVKDRFGNDPGLLAAAREITLTGAQAIDVLELDDGTEPSEDELSALEAVVSFDGTRPSFLVKQNEVDFDSSFNTGAWRSDLNNYLPKLSPLFACTGRVELGETLIGTAFLVTPNLAMTNRHVAQAIARFTPGEIELKPGVHLDFGREEWDGRKSFDRREVESVAFAGASAIVSPLDHHKLDLAVLRVSASALAGDLGQRRLTTHHIDSSSFAAAPYVATVGYPSNPEVFAPQSIRSRFDDILKRLLEGDGGSKRFAPGTPSESSVVDASVTWTVCHDATTINGNSGSPVLTLSGAGVATVRLAGLHYGGSWGGERVNWAHLLSATGGGAGHAVGSTFADFCRTEGIAF